MNKKTKTHQRKAVEIAQDLSWMPHVVELDDRISIASAFLASMSVKTKPNLTLKTIDVKTAKLISELPSDTPFGPYVKFVRLLGIDNVRRAKKRHENKSIFGFKIINNGNGLGGRHARTDCTFYEPVSFSLAETRKAHFNMCIQSVLDTISKT